MREPNKTATPTQQGIYTISACPIILKEWVTSFEGLAKTACIIELEAAMVK